jgi:hypothetical protein
MKILIFTTFLETQYEKGIEFLYFFFHMCLPSLQQQINDNWEIHLFLNYLLDCQIIKYLEQFEIKNLKLHFIMEKDEILIITQALCQHETSYFGTCILDYNQSLSSNIVEILQQYKELKNHYIVFSNGIDYNIKNHQTQLIHKHFITAINQNIYQLNTNSNFITNQNEISYGYIQHI